MGMKAQMGIFSFPWKWRVPSGLRKEFAVTLLLFQRGSDDWASNPPAKSSQDTAGCKPNLLYFVTPARCQTCATLKVD